MSQYLLASEHELDRLQLQARVWEAEASHMFDAIGVQPGWRCVDLGCGAMGVLGLLSKRTGPTGDVAGVDRDATYLAGAEHYVTSAQLANVRLLHQDVLESGLPGASFDLVHERWVMPHVDNPQALLEEMIRLAKPGGIIAIQESDQSSWNFYPPSARWPRLRNLIEAGFALRGDINIGRRTFHMLRGAGLQDVRIRAAVVALQDCHPYMRLPVLGVQAMRGPMVAAGITTDGELDELIADVESRAANPETMVITFTVTQVWARKPD